jgi:hypothetical protein
MVLMKLKIIPSAEFSNAFGTCVFPNQNCTPSAYSQIKIALFCIPPNKNYVPLNQLCLPKVENRCFNEILDSIETIAGVLEFSIEITALP